MEEHRLSEIDSLCGMHKGEEKYLQYFGSYLIVGEKIVCNKMHLKEREWEGEYSSTSEQGQVVSSCEHGNEPVGSLKCRES